MFESSSPPDNIPTDIPADEPHDEQSPPTGHQGPLMPPPPDEEPPATEDEAPTLEIPIPEAVAPEPESAERQPETGDETEHVELPDELPILPLKDTVVYPFAVMPLGVGKERSIRLIDDVMRGSRLVGLVAQKDAEIEEAGPDDCYRMGTVARIARLLRIPDGTIQIIVQGLERIAIDEFVAEQPYLKARAHLAPETMPRDIEIEAMKRTAIDLFQRLVNLVQYLPDQLAMAAMNLDDP